ncbi:hypothetical protein ACWEGQ_28795 [Streptomyces seoulensis]
MEHTALRPKPMPGQEPGGGGAPGGPDRRPAAPAPRRGRRPVAVAYVLLAALVLLLAGIGLGTVGGTVIALTRTAGHPPPRQTPAPGAVPTGPGRASPGPSLPAPSGVGRSPSGVGRVPR